MVIAFLDLLGFSWLVENNSVAANDNLISFNSVIRTKIIDEKNHPAKTYTNNNGLRDFAQNSSISSFQNMISISDSLIIGSDSPDIFVKQLCNFVATTFIEYSEPFKKTFLDITSVHNNKISDATPHHAFPILFRGGISYGDDVIFSKEGQIFQNNFNGEGLNVCGLPYVEAVQLEKNGKGPRFFCNQKFVDSLSPNECHAIRRISENLYEIVWTYYACEATGFCVSDKMKNISDSINDKLLIRAINLYSFYYKHQDPELEAYQQQYKHYEEFILLICRGLLKYADDNSLNISQTREMLNSSLKDLEIDLNEISTVDFI